MLSIWYSIAYLGSYIVFQGWTSTSSRPYSTPKRVSRFSTRIRFQHIFLSTFKLICVDPLWSPASYNQRNWSLAAKGLKISNRYQWSELSHRLSVWSYQKWLKSLSSIWEWLPKFKYSVTCLRSVLWTTSKRQSELRTYSNAPSCRLVLLIWYTVQLLQHPSPIPHLAISSW